MIDEEITFGEKGYYSTDLKPNSHKRVYAVCEGDDCEREDGRGRWVEFVAYTDFCHACAMKNLPIQKCETPTEKLPWVDDDITFAEKGYRSTDLKPGSNKPVWAICQGENCEREGGRGRWVAFQKCVSLCHACAHKTEEYRIKNSDAHMGKYTGENSPGWKGGITPWRTSMWHSQAYKNWRKAVFKRDDYTCQMCNERGVILEAHHILHIRDNKNTLLIFDIDNGITLCKKCHDKTKRKEYEFVDRFQKIVNSKH